MTAVGSEGEAGPPGAKKRDYWWTVLVVDPVAVPLVRLLARHRLLTPDSVSGLALLCGLGVGPVFAIGGRWSLVAGGVLFYIAFLLDCTDGKLARALGVTSARGEALDHLADGARRASAVLGMAVHVWRSDDFSDADIWWVIVYAVLAYYFLEISGAEKGDAVESGIRGRASAALARHRLLPNPGMPDVQAITFTLGPITGLVLPAFALGIGMSVAAIFLTVWRRLR
jgi:phosphatidylglycerophosphate synthase